MPALRIMVIEDEDEQRELLQEYLGRLGHRVDAARSGREAMLHLADLDRPYDVVLVDWHLPGITGRDVADTVRERCPGCKVLVITGKPDAFLSKALAAGDVAGLVRKPFRLAELARRIVELAADDDAPTPPESSRRGG